MLHYSDPYFLDSKIKGIISIKEVIRLLFYHFIEIDIRLKEIEFLFVRRDSSLCLSVNKKGYRFLTSIGSPLGSTMGTHVGITVNCGSERREEARASDEPALKPVLPLDCYVK